MKVIDQTPFFNPETGEISVLDRGKAVMKFGAAWFKEIEAQKTVIALLGKVLDKNYTLLRNITLPGLDAMLPFILIGPTGVFVMDVTPLSGMFRAKADQWGTISGSNFKPEKPNLLVRTERLARVVQVYLQRQGYSDLPPVEPILLCANPSIHVDSLRPIIRVVMRDALERFAVSIAQARVVLSPEAAREIVDRFLASSRPASAEAPKAAVPAAVEETPASAFALPESDTVQSFPEAKPAPDYGTNGAPVSPATPPRSAAQPAPASLLPQRRRRRSALSRGQLIVLIVGFLFWCLLVAGFIFAIIQFAP